MKSCVGTSPGLGGGLSASFLAAFCCSDFSWRDSNRRRFHGHPSGGETPNTKEAVAERQFMRALSGSCGSWFSVSRPEILGKNRERNGCGRAYLCLMEIVASMSTSRHADGEA